MSVGVPRDFDGIDQSNIIERKRIWDMFTMRSLTNPEILDIFTMADISRDGNLSVDEWRAFHKFFVGPWEKCVSETQKFSGVPEPTLFSQTQTYLSNVTGFNSCIGDAAWLRSMASPSNKSIVWEGFGKHEDPQVDSCLSNQSIVHHHFNRKNAPNLNTLKVEPVPAEGEPPKEDQIAIDLMLAADRDLDGHLNFNEYLTIRRAAIA